MSRGNDRPMKTRFILTVQVSLRPSGKSFVVDLWLTEKYANPTWLCMDFNTAYNRYVFYSG